MSTSMGKPALSLVVAMDRNRVIGRGGDLPWRLPDDLKQFKQTTLGHTILMGRRTWDSLGRPLPGRDNWVLSRSSEFSPQGARVFASLDDALAAFEGDELMVIGGGELYKQALPRARRLYLTEVDTEVADGDTWFPAFDPADFEELACVGHGADERHAWPFRFRTLQRRESPTG